MDDAADWPKLVWVLDARDETNPVPISTCPMPPVEAFAKRGGRFGAHNLHENMPLADVLVLRQDHRSARSSTAACAPTTSPTRTSRRRSRTFVPPAPPLSPARRDPAQRRVRRRARDRLHGRPLHRRAVHASRWISEFARANGPKLGSPPRDGSCAAAPRPTGCRRARRVRAYPGHRRHRLPRRRQDHAAQALPRHAGRRRHRRGRQRVRRRRHRRCSCCAASSDETVLLGNGCLCCITRSDLQVALRALVTERERGQVPHFRQRGDRDQRARRPGPIAADLRDRPRARRRILGRGRGGGGRRGERPRHARLVGRGAQAGRSSPTA